MSGEPVDPVNSQTYWERRFAGDWQALGGREQSRTFMDLVVRYLPAVVHDEIVGERLSLLDCGCALGDGTALLAERFPASAVAGCDWSATAVGAARAAYPQVEFFASDFAGLERRADVLVSSNCFEHLERPIAALERLLVCARRYVLLLVPLAEGYPPHAEHVRIVHARTFPAELAGWRLAERIVLPPSTAWSGLQLLLIYRPAAEGAAAVPEPAMPAEAGDALLGLEAAVAGLAGGLAGVGERLSSLRAETLERGRQEAGRARAEAERARGEAARASADAVQARAEAAGARADAERVRAEVDRALGEAAALRRELAAARETAAERLERLEHARRRARWQDGGARALASDFFRTAALAEGRRGEAAALATERDRLAARLAEAEGRLAPLERSRAVAAVHRFWRLLGLLAPEGTARRRAYGRVMGTGRAPGRAPVPPAPVSVPPAEGPRQPDPAWDEDLRRFAALVEADEEASGTVVALLAGTALREAEGQRPTRLALELAARGIPVVFAYFRWSAAERCPQDRLGQGILQVPLDVLAERPGLLAAAFRGRRRVALCEFPYPPLFELVAALHGAGWIVVYDGLDDWEEFHRRGQALWYEEMFERHLASAADAVFAVTPLLADRLRTLGAAEVEVLPNGLLPGIAEVGAAVAAPGGEVTVGYFGHLTAAWFDWELIAGAARARPTWRFELIGYGGAPESELPGNVVLLGPRPQQDLAAYAARWDAGIVPFKPGRLAASADPIKTYEYLAMGLPVVVTGVLPPPAGAAFVRRADGLDGFLAALIEEAEAARSRPQAAAERRAFAATCTWAARVDSLLAALARRGQRVGEKEELFRMAR